MIRSNKETLCLAATKICFAPNYFSGIKLVVSLSGRFDCDVNGEQLRGLTGLMLNRSIQHTLLATDASLLLYYLDRHNDLEASLHQQLATQSWCDLSARVNTLLLPDWIASTLSAGLDRGLNAIARQVLAALFPTESGPEEGPGDGRSEQLTEFIHEHIQYSINLDQLAALLSLSAERTRHVIEEQLGMSFRQYILWVRLKSVIQTALTQPGSLSRTALDWGFTDQSHFNRRFKRTFGTNPNALLNYRNDNQFLLL